uniref:Uncharacterized protein n=1 Tax=Rhizophora mucronata TaxID=61149 RepID=A0A2P2PYL1_RHIMU
MDRIAGKLLILSSRTLFIEIPWKKSGTSPGSMCYQ